MGPLGSFLKAMEAEDITGQVDKEMVKAIGKKSVTSSGSKRDIMETDDILGSKSTKTPDVSKDPPKDVDEDVDPDLSTDDSDDSDTDSDDLDTDPIGDDDSDIGTEEENKDDSKNSEEFTNKLRLRENMILFYNILSSNINLLSEYVPDSSSEENSNAISLVSTNFLDCKESLYNIITEELESKTYVELLRKYIALNRVYDLNIDMLGKYFNNLKLIETTKNKKRVKSEDKDTKKEKE